MKLFVVKNNSGAVVGSGDKTKTEAKVQRTSFHKEAGIVESEIENWSKDAKFKVSKGEDHIKYRGKRKRYANG